jgi:hypothetical protein
LISLRGREIRFENAVGHEHFEDILVDKRLWIISPRDFYELGYDWEKAVQKWCNFLYQTVKPELATFRSKLRDRFDYRLLVDWGYGRSWKQLYIIYEPCCQREKDAIKDFSEFATKHSKLAFNLFALHPINLEELEADPCSVCLSNFEGEEIVLE